MTGPRDGRYDVGVNADPRGPTRERVGKLARAGLDWVTFSAEVSEALQPIVGFDDCCWHSVDPGTILLTGSVSSVVSCSASFLATHEYVIEDVNKWAFLARSGRLAGATSIATHGDLSRSARHRAAESFGWGDELRGSFVLDGTYWGAVGFLRYRDQPWFTTDDERFLASLSEPLAEGFRSAMLVAAATAPAPLIAAPGVVIFGADGRLESISPAAEQWIDQLVESPPPSSPDESRAVQAVAALARAAADGLDPLELAARARVRTRSGSWLLLYGTPLAGGRDGRTAVIIQPAGPTDVVPLVALAYGLSERERQVTLLCMQGLSTKQMAAALAVSPYTVQDHLKAIFAKTGVGTRGELVGQIFLEHYIPRWDDAPAAPPGWLAKLTPADPARSPDLVSGGTAAGLGST